MLEIILLFFACFIIFLLFLPFAIVGIDVICGLFRQLKCESNYQLYDNRQLAKDLTVDSVNDSEGDGLILFDDPLFPPKFDDD